MSERERRRCLEVLGLPHSSSEDDIKKAYRKLALQHHPDKNAGGDGAKEKFQEISYAYKYLIEGPPDEDDEDDGIPIEVLIRLFPWMFGAPFHSGFAGFHNGFPPRFHYHDYCDPYDDYYDDSDDSECECCSHNHKSKSTYVPGPTKEEKKRERKKKARERRKAAKQGKAQASAQQKASEVPNSTHSNSNKPSSYSADINTEKKPDIVEEKKGDIEKENENNGTEAKEEKAKNQPKASARVPQASQQKKSNKQLRKEQKARQKEMDEIGKEFKRQQEEKAAKEAQRQAAKEERLAREAIQKEQAEKNTTKTNVNNSATKKDPMTNCNDHFGMKGNQYNDMDDIDEDDEIIDPHYDLAEDVDDTVEEVIHGKKKKKKKQKEVYVEVEQEDLSEDEEDDDTSSISNNRFAALKKTKPQAKKKQTKAKKPTEKPVPSASTNNTKPKQLSHGSRTFVNSNWNGPKTASSFNQSYQKSTYNVNSKQDLNNKKISQDKTKKSASNGRNQDNSQKFEKIAPQSEAEEMQMFHEAIMRSQMEDAMPQCEKEEHRMLEEALKESKMAAQWYGNIDTLDDVSDGEGCAPFNSGASGGVSAARSQNWHTSIGAQTANIRHDKENVRPGFKLGGLGTGNRGYVNPVGPENRVKTGKNREPSVNNDKGGQFDPTVGSKVKHEASWEFGGSSYAGGFQFNSDFSFGGLNSGFSFSNNTSNKPSVNIQSGTNNSAKQKQSSAYDLPRQKSQSFNQGKNVSMPSWAAPMNDMDDIDDVDTFEDMSSPYSCSAQPSGSFDLNIPAAMLNKDKMKSYYSRKK